MKIIQLNVWSGRLLGNVVALVNAEKPDILCLQEAISFDGEVYSLFGTIEELQAKIDNPFKKIYYSPGMNFRFMHKFAGWGNCILTNFPIDSEITKFTHLSFIEDFNFDAHDYNARNFQHIVVEAKNKKLNVLNHHGYHIPNHKNGNQETLRQMKELGEYIDKLKGPVVLAGDFNLAPRSESLEQINQRLQNLSVRYRLKTTRTALTHKTEVCDYIFINDEVEVNNFSVSNTIMSDHKALILDFDL